MHCILTFVVQMLWNVKLFIFSCKTLVLTFASRSRSLLKCHISSSYASLKYYNLCPISSFFTLMYVKIICKIKYECFYAVFSYHNALYLFKP